LSSSDGDRAAVVPVLPVKVPAAVRDEDRHFQIHFGQKNHVFVLFAERLIVSADLFEDLAPDQDAARGRNGPVITQKQSEISVEA
jgi:hypothetical protein